jgi:hypothetical protein
MRLEVQQQWGSVHAALSLLLTALIPPHTFHIRLNEQRGCFINLKVILELLLGNESRTIEETVAKAGRGVR